MTRPIEQAADAVERELADLRAKLAQSEADKNGLVKLVKATHENNEALRAKLAVAVEAADYLLHAVDDLMDGSAYPITDVHLMVEEGAKIQSVADARAAIEETKK